MTKETLTYVIAAITLAAGCAGETGDRGPAGPAGTDGTDGSDGTDGQNGTNGTNGTDGNDASARILSFAPVTAPVTDVDKRHVIAAPEAYLDGHLVSLGYTTEIRSGMTVAGQVFGRIVDKNGDPIKQADNSDFISPSNDFSSLLAVGTSIYEVTHFETQPGAMYISQVSQNTAGALTITSTKPIDFASVHGLWIPCAGSVTPWNTHLGSEEYPQDARQTEHATTVAQVTGGSNTNFLRYFGVDPTTATVADAKAVFDPYYYGYPVEVSVGTGGTTSVKKH